MASAESADAGTTKVRGRRKVLEGRVVSDKMDKTVVVKITHRLRDPKYGKFVTRWKKYKAHDEANSAGTGDLVRIIETRPLSKEKRWRVQDILEKAVGV